MGKQFVSLTFCLFSSECILFILAQGEDGDGVFFFFSYFFSLSFSDSRFSSDTEKKRMSGQASVLSETDLFIRTIKDERSNTYQLVI